MNLFEHTQGALEVVSHSDGRRIKEASQWPNRKAVADFVKFREAKKWKKGNVFPMLIKVDTSLTFSRI